MQDGQQRHLVVAGNGMVGQRLVEAVRDRDARRDVAGDRAVGGAAPRLRPGRAVVVLRRRRRGRPRCRRRGLLRPDGYALRLGEAVTAIDRAARTVTTERGASLGYDALVLATGSYPFVPPVPGHDLPGCFVYRTLDDLDAIRAAAERAAVRTRGRRAGLVVGGGLLGLEAARALRLLGLSPHVVELAPRLMPLQVDEGGGALLRRADRGPRGDRAPAARSVGSIERGRAAGCCATLAERHRAGPRPRGVLGRGAPARPAGPRRRAWPSASAAACAVDDGCRTSDPRHLGRSASARWRSAGGCTAWSRPATRWPRWWPTGCSAAPPASPAPTLSTKLKLLGRGRGQLRRRARRAPRARSR